MKKEKIENAAPKTGSAAMEEKKYTESELNAACGQIYQRLVKEIQSRDMSNMFKRLDYLFLVIKNKDCFSDTFVYDCIQEIETALTPVEPDSDDEENKD